MAKRFGVMLDMSRNAVMRPDELKKYIKTLADFGYNMVQLYTEDTYEVEGEPYFGYLRGRYSAEELRDVVDYAESLGVEVIPCIQTLAHLNCIFNWKKYAEMLDTHDILMADDERTYEFIENMFKSLRKCFKTDIVHIGMDEAFMLGLGKHLEKHGFENRFDIIYRHLKKVIAISEKYGFRPIMWSDMFFRLANGGNYYDWTNITDEVIAACPDGVDLVYWDYYHTEKSFFDGMIAAHRKFGRDVWFAGGVWTWGANSPLATFSNNSMSKAMAACSEANVENVMFTMWGDNGRECSFWSVLPTLYYLKRYHDGERDMDKIRREFYEITGEDFDAMTDLELPNMVAGNRRESPSNVAKVMLFSDPLLGFLDVTVKDGVGREYASHRDKLREYAKKSGQFGYIFDTLAHLCNVLEIKYGIGAAIRRAYKEGDRQALAALADDARECARRVRDFHAAFSIQWHKENKPHGFEIHDSRLGGVSLRLESVAARIDAYLAGNVPTLEELDEELLPYALSHDQRHVINGTPGTEGIPNFDTQIHAFTVGRTS